MDNIAGPASNASFVSRYSYEDLDIDVEAAEVKRNGRLVPTTRMEFQLLRYFVEHRGTALSRDELSREVWGYRSKLITRTVDQHVFCLRQKVERDPKNPQLILTIPGVGYKFVA
jgi:two-component system alkaline phosphatase synthesis response regulator PhoP